MRFAPRTFAASSARCTAGRLPGNDHLTGGVEIHRLDDRAVRGLAAHGDDRLVLETEDGGHRAASGGDGFLHDLAAKAHQLHGLRKARAPARTSAR